MGREYAEINATITSFIERQQMFFVATAPLAGNGHVNLSPKGLDTFRIVSPTTVAYLDYVGSGAETIAHLRENGRIAIMFCAFTGSPKILRLYGRGSVIEPSTDEFRRLRRLFPSPTEARSIITVAVDRIADSCGFGVPLYRYEAQRSDLIDWTGRKSGDGLLRYQAAKNARSIDGMAAVDWTSGDAATDQAAGGGDARPDAHEP